MKKSLLKITLTLAGLLLVIFTYSQAQSADDIIGKWLNEDQDAHVQIYKENGKFYGKIVWLKEPNEPATGLPKLEVPAQVAEKKPRLFELRTYEAHSRKANKKKVEMFNVGEIAIFRRTGLQPVFFGETLVGTKLPNLTYMLVFDDMAARDKNWATFVGDPEWKKLSTTPGYTNAEILTNITNVFLKPAAYSQI